MCSKMIPPAPLDWFLTIRRRMRRVLSCVHRLCRKVLWGVRSFVNCSELVHRFCNAGIDCHEDTAW